MKTKLSDKQEAFCQAYAIAMNGSQAARSAGYSKKSANRQASANMSKAYIQARVKEIQAERVAALGITSEFILNGIKDIAVTGEKDSDRTKALDMLGKYAGIYEADNTQSKTEIASEIKFTFV